MSALPTGTVTFLMTDIERSTAMWERDPDLMAAALQEHDIVVATTVNEFSGRLIKSKGEGDSTFSVFSKASDAVLCAHVLRQRLSAVVTPGGGSLKVRAAVHTGQAEERQGDYFGPSVNRCARLRAAAVGGSILISQASQLLLDGQLPANCRLRDHGSRRLKDLLRPERIFEVVGDDLGDVAQPKTLDLALHNLPIQLTSFVGREPDVQALISLVAEHRLVTVIGVGGSGKTRLALQAATELVDSLAGGIWLVELGLLDDSGLSPRAIAEALSLQGVTNQASLISALAEYALDRPTALLLDNCEHLVEELSDLVGRLLRSCPNLRIIATSREPFLISGEVPFRLPPLAVPCADESLSVNEAADFDAVTLFVERARTAHSDFRLSEENAEAVGTICRRLAGIPLAIEQAAAATSFLTPGQILHRWEHSTLLGQERARTDRHQTLRACFDWSYSSMELSEQTLFGSLAVFAGSFSIEAAESVCSHFVAPHDVLSIIRSLCLKSMLSVEEGVGGKRFRLLEPLREYALHKNVVDESLRGRHLTWFSQFAEQANEHLIGPKQALWQQLVDEEYPNLWAALEYGVSANLPAAAELANGLRRYWLRKGLLSEGRKWLEAAGRLPAVDQTTLAINSHVLGAISFHEGNISDASAQFRRSYELACEVSNRTLMADAGLNVGICACQLEQFAEGTRYLTSSLAEYQALGNRQGEGQALLNLGVSQRHLGQLDESIETLTKAAHMFDEGGNASLYAAAQSNLAVALSEQGRQREAVFALRRSFETWQKQPDVTLMIGGLHDLYRFAIASDLVEDAAVIYGAASKMSRSSASRLHGWPCLDALPVDRVIHGERLSLAAVTVAALETCDHLLALH